MMPLYIILAAVAVGASVPALAWTAMSARSESQIVRSNLGSALSRPLAAVRRSQRPQVSLLPTSYVDDITRRLDRAGLHGKIGVDRYFAFKTIGVVVTVIIGGIIGFRFGGPGPILFPFIGGLVVWLLPDLQLSGVADRREGQLELQLPDVLDQLTISVEAGLGFDAALKRLSESGDGPVTEQLSRVLQDMRLGLSRDAALKALADRSESLDLRTFANSMSQASRHGLPIAGVLRAQAAEAREKRKFRAEERAHKVPVKILLPLVLCVLPTLFIVLIGPAIIRYQDGFGG
jgi:tight adherence protein C